MVNAMAPNAPTGAARTMMRITAKNILAAVSIAPAMRWPISPSCAMANPERIDTSSTCKRSPRASAPMKESAGMIASRCATIPSSLARFT